MADFAPAGVFRMGYVPFDMSYRHTMTFSSASAQNTYFASIMEQAVAENSYTYIRHTRSVKVPFNRELLCKYNYCMFQNANYGTKWFYAFITNIDYINENTSEVFFEIDVMQTWYFDYTLEPAMVEREHVNDDVIGNYTNDEPCMDLKWEYGTYSWETLAPRYMVLMVNAYPFYNSSGTEVQGSRPISGGLYHNQYSACKYLVYDMLGGSQWKAKLQQDLDAYNGAGAGETICDCFTTGSRQLPLSDLEDFYAEQGSLGSTKQNFMFQMKEGTQPPVHERTCSLPTTIGSYTPKNKKLFTYPYCYIEVGDFSGRCTDYRFEWFDADNIGRFQIETPCCPDTVAYIEPYNYNGATNFYASTPFTADMSNKVSWVYSAYQNWAAQNGVVNQLAVMGSIGAVTLSVLPGASAAANVLGAAARTPGALNVARAGLDNTRQIAAHSRGMGDAFMGGINEGALGAGAMGIGSVLANNDRMSKQPNVAQGYTGGNARMQCGYAGFYIAQRYLREEQARCVDNFFSMYGYAVDRVKIPNRTGRANWNYVKMQNSCHRGQVPASDMALINSIYDKGITFWHTSDVGNYNLDNSPIGG